ncbi:MAG TPA: nucleotide exchange factor GrpE [Candidatus Bipolaricaulota bacterium]|nr:nucleotide exchange factor GrpE [Candidatus Bipolaricaulota bacterium]
MSKEERKKDDKNWPKKIQELTDRAAENLAGWQRAKADYENLLKESSARQAELGKFIKKDLIVGILPVLNSFCQAEKSVPENKKDDNWVKGFMCIKRQLDEILKNWGVEQIKTVGEKFDPTLHEAVGEETSDEKEGVIVKEVMPGYELNKETVVFAKVIVSK